MCPLPNISPIPLPLLSPWQPSILLLLCELDAFRFHVEVRSCSICHSAPGLVTSQCPPGSPICPRWQIAFLMLFLWHILVSYSVNVAIYINSFSSIKSTLHFNLVMCFNHSEFFFNILYRLFASICSWVKLNNFFFILLSQSYSTKLNKWVWNFFLFVTSEKMHEIRIRYTQGNW
jgi:hypothetical protein